MDGQIVLLIISAAIFISYALYITYTYGIQKSISASWYKLPNNWRFIFTFTLWGFAIPVMIVGDSALFFMAGGLICFVGAAASFRDLSMTYKVHMVGAYGGVLLGFAAIVINLGYYILPSISALAIVIIWFTVKHKIWWIEITAFSTVLIALILDNI